MNECPVCGRSSLRPWKDAAEHFQLYAPGYWRYLRGNCKTFGLVSGCMATIGLAFPFFNTLRHWKYRKHRLDGLEFVERQ